MTLQQEEEKATWKGGGAFSHPATRGEGLKVVGRSCEQCPGERAQGRAGRRGEPGELWQSDSIGEDEKPKMSSSI